MEHRNTPALFGKARKLQGEMEGWFAELKGKELSGE
jgi:hypothetical protein